MILFVFEGEEREPLLFRTLERMFSFVKDNWKCLVDMNVKKANFLVSGHNVLPVEKSTIGQRFIFDAQLEKFVGENESVAVLNSFPLFLFEYLKVI